MDIDLSNLEQNLGITPGLVIHAGANMCQEKDVYAKSNFGPVYWIEAIPKYVELSKNSLTGYKDQHIIEAALWSKDGLSKQFNISSNDGLSSSLFKMKWHRALQPSISMGNQINVVTKTLDSVVSASRLESKIIQLLVLDLQGAELEALLGSEKTLESVQAVHIEVSRVQLYESQPTFMQIHAFLTNKGFALVKHDLSDEVYAGDALYVKERYLNVDTGYSVMGDVVSIPLKPKNWLKYKLVQLGVPARLLKRKSR